MKKVLFAAVAVCAISFANAQTGAASDQTSVGVGLRLKNVIKLTPPCDLMWAEFNNSGDYNGGKYLHVASDLAQTTPTYSVSSTRPFHVTVKGNSANFSYSGTGTGNNVMPIGVLQFRVNNVSDGTNAQPGFTPLTTSDQSLVTGAPYGANRTFNFTIKADPQWNFTGGDYTVGMTFTATQD